MINLDQIQILEKKVNNAVEIINNLTQENKSLKRTINNSQERVQEMENLLEQFKNEQELIEKGILNALNQLDHLEDAIESDEEAPLALATEEENQVDPETPQIQDNIIEGKDPENNDQTKPKEPEPSEPKEAPPQNHETSESSHQDQDLLFIDTEEVESPTDTEKEKAPVQDSEAVSEQEEKEIELDIF